MVAQVQFPMRGAVHGAHEEQEQVQPGEQEHGTPTQKQVMEGSGQLQGQEQSRRDQKEPEPGKARSLEAHQEPDQTDHQEPMFQYARCHEAPEPGTGARPERPSGGGDETGRKPGNCKDGEHEAGEEEADEVLLSKPAAAGEAGA